MADQDKMGIRRRLFQHFQQCVCRDDVHAFSRCKHDDLAQAKTRGPVGKLDNLANLINFYDAALTLWRQPLEIAMGAAGREFTGMALTAIQPRGRLRAQ